MPFSSDPASTGRTFLASTGTWPGILAQVDVFIANTPGADNTALGNFLSGATITHAATTYNMRGASAKFQRQLAGTYVAGEHFPGDRGVGN